MELTLSKYLFFEEKRTRDVDKEWAVLPTMSYVMDRVGMDIGYVMPSV